MNGLAHLRANYRDIAEFAFELSEAWRRLDASGERVRAHAAESEYRIACETARETGERIRSFEARVLMEAA